MTTETTRPRVKAVWAEGVSLGGDVIIGDRSQPSGLPWPHDTDDLRHFREETRGHVLVMGRGTFDSLPAILKSKPSVLERPLIVLTHDPGAVHHAGHNAGSHLQGISWATDHAGVERLLKGFTEPGWLWEEFYGKPVAVIGGSKVIELFEPYTDEAVVSHMRGRFTGDVPAPADRYFEGFAVRERRRLETGHVITRSTRKEPAQ